MTEVAFLSDASTALFHCLPPGSAWNSCSSGIVISRALGDMDPSARRCHRPSCESAKAAYCSST